MSDFKIRKIVSGGQTGVDRAALDFALENGFSCGGWCPKGRKAEDGVLPLKYPLKETPSSQYNQRTEWNVRDSDGTLILTEGRSTGGTALTIYLARLLKKPCLILDLKENPQAAAVLEWIEKNNIQTLNIAGPRESTSPGIYRKAKNFLSSLKAPKKL